MQSEVDFITYLEAFIPLSVEAKTALSGVLKVRQYAKREYIVPLNGVNDLISFVVKGCVREYYLNEQTEEVVVWFGLEKDIAVSLPSFISQKPSHTAIQAIEPTKVIQVSREDLYQLYDQFHEIERLGRIIAEHYLMNSDSYIKELQTQNAAERYQHLMEQKPQILQRVPLSMIASFLGISGETLSRIRAKRVSR
ncbi:Crp/Fnr family transcriptional regulator [Runella sp. SP2]|uniref:Crp/Fnr family transcriptional regulator n=1 Tax=Runella sp. SP2 TaxID=2268026 RepID=UPI000F081ACB|nr:Crp/Fnr family transcriptional regulator [Runella sp. SP2]AYQ34359.1 Crp/Fnr family transcriptional regulator [Runella sp. SP2]